MYWTGYFTSKPHLKRSIREASSYLQSVKKLLSKFYFQGKISFKDIDNSTHSFETALSTLQHHDAVTGTAKRFVDLDYERILTEGYKAIQAKLFPLMKNQFEESHPNAQIKPFSFVLHLSNVSLSQEGQIQQEAQSVAAYVYNPSQIQTRLVRFEVPSGSGTRSLI